MAFGDVYGYLTNSRYVAAVAESEERTREVGEEPNPDFDDTVDPDPETNPETVPVTETVVDLVLLGFANGRRNNVVVAAEGDARVNQAVVGPTAGDTAPGETTARGSSTGATGDGTGDIA